MEEDEWGETPRVSNAGVTRKTKGAWRGTTWFSLEHARPLPGPARRRIVGKKPPLFVTEEWELLRKLRTDPEFHRGALVDSLSVAGIERQQLAAAQRVCPDLRVVYLGKLAESLSQDVRQTLLELRKEAPDAFKDKKIDAVVRTLDKFEMINHVLFRRVYNPVSNQVELRCAVPTGASSRFDFPGRGFTPPRVPGADFAGVP